MASTRSRKRVLRRSITQPTEQDLCQRYIAENATIVLTYFNQLAKYVNLMTMFRDGKRLFFKQDNQYPGIDQVDLTDVDALFNQSIILTSFEEKFKEWVPAINEENIESTRKRLKNYFFHPIEINKAFQLFIRSQVAMQKSDQGKNTHTEEDMRTLSANIAGALVFKIGMSWLQWCTLNTVRSFSKKKSDKKLLADQEKSLTEQARQAGLLVKVMNTNEPACNLIANVEADLRAFIQAELSNLINQLKEEKIKEKAFGDHLEAVFKKIQNDTKFKALDRAVIILCEQLPAQLVDKVPQEQKHVREQGAKVILQFIREEFCSNGDLVLPRHLADYMHIVKQLLGIIQNDLDKEGKEYCAPLLQKSMLEEKKLPQTISGQTLRKLYGSGLFVFGDSRAKLPDYSRGTTPSSPRSAPTTPRVSDGRQRIQRKESKVNLRDILFAAIEPGDTSETSPDTSLPGGLRPKK